MSKINDNHQDIELKDFFRFGGRINRSKYFNIIGCNYAVIITIIILFFMFKMLGNQYNSEIFKLISDVLYNLFRLSIVLGVFSIIINGFRRAQDSNLSGWISLIPIYNIYIFWFKKGTEGYNSYGNNPLEKTLEEKNIDIEKINKQIKTLRTISLICILGGFSSLLILFFIGYL